MFDVALTEILCFADFSEPLSNLHGGKANSYRGEGQSPNGTIVSVSILQGCLGPEAFLFLGQ